MTTNRKIKIGDLCVKITDGAHHSPKTVESSGFPMASVKDMTPFGINLQSCRNISKEDFEKLVKQGCKPEKNDILIAKDGNSCLETVFVQREEQEVVLLSSVAILRPDVKKVNPKFLSSYLSDLNIIREMKELLVSGSAIPRVILKAFREYEICLPSIEVQNKIASIMEAIDNKIELNMEMNETLEEMAKSLYKHWFIDYGPFQSEGVVNSEQGLVPEGWIYKSLSEIAEILMGQSPKSEFYNQEDNGLPFHQGVKDFGIRYPSHSVFCTKELRVANEGDILISVRAPVGRINVANTRLIIGRGLCAINSKTGHNSFLLYTLKNIFSEEDQHGSGTVFNSINKKDIENFKVVYPSREFLDNFEGHVSKYDKQNRENSIEIKHLQTLRNYLLPRLLSGELNLPFAEKQVEVFE